MSYVDKICPRCSRQIEGQAKFCTGCGARLGAGTEEMQRCPGCQKLIPGQAKFCTGCGSGLRVEEDPNLGKLIKDSYALKKLLGKGATGRVYLAEQLALKKKVAVKLLDPFYADDPTSKARFEREALAASRLTHANSINVHDFGETADGALFLVMEYAEGESLAEVIAESGGLPPGRVCEILTQICSALVEAHEQGVIHRDLKPENIVLVQQRDGRELVKVLDFGIAQIVTGEEAQRKITRMGLVCGTPEYMSPEQARSKKLDARTDVYSLGVMLYEALTGTIPFEDISALKVAQMHIHDPPDPFAVRRPDLAIPDVIERVCFHALEKKRSQRYQTALEFQQALEEARRVIAQDEEKTEIILPPPGEVRRDPVVVQVGQGANFTPAPFGYRPPAREYFDSVGLDLAGRLDALDVPGPSAAPLPPAPLVAPVTPDSARNALDPMAGPISRGGSSIELDFARASLETADTGHQRSRAFEPGSEVGVAAAPSEPFVWPRWATYLALGAVLGVIAILIIELQEPDLVDRGDWKPPADQARAAAERLQLEGLALLREQDFKAAVERFRGALRTDPTHYSVHRDLGTAYTSLKRPRQAMRQYRMSADPLGRHDVA